MSGLVQTCRNGLGFSSWGSTRQLRSSAIVLTGPLKKPTRSFFIHGGDDPGHIGPRNALRRPGLKVRRKVSRNHLLPGSHKAGQMRRICPRFRPPGQDALPMPYAPMKARTTALPGPLGRATRTAELSDTPWRLIHFAGAESWAGTWASRAQPNPNPAPHCTIRRAVSLSVQFSGSVTATQGSM